MPRTAHRSAALAAALAAATLTGCSATSPATPDPDQQAVHTADAYMHAWLDLPSTPEQMCRLQAPAMHPNYRADGGTLAGCVAAYQHEFAGQDTHRPPLTLTVTDPQPVPATATEPAGIGVLVTGHRTGGQPFRYAVRLVQQSGAWLVAQATTVDEDRYGHTADPVAPVLEAA